MDEPASAAVVVGAPATGVEALTAQAGAIRADLQPAGTGGREGEWNAEMSLETGHATLARGQAATIRRLLAETNGASG